MALFFDSPWFDGRLRALGLSRADLARTLGLGEEDIAGMFKDQREVSAAEVTLMAALLAISPAKIADRAGISTPVPAAAAKPDPVLERLERVERELAAIKQLLARRTR